MQNMCGRFVSGCGEGCVYWSGRRTCVFRFCFIKLSLLLIAIETRNEDGTETNIAINPGHELKLDSNSQGFFIAESADDVKRSVHTGF